MRHVINIPIHKDKEDPEILILYELISTVVRKVLEKIIAKMHANQLTDGDTITIYEISMTLCTILQNANQFAFSDLDLMRVHNQNELKIHHLKQQRPERDEPQQQDAGGRAKHLFAHLKTKIGNKISHQEVPGRFSDADFAKNGRPKFKCAYEDYQYPKDEPLTAEIFRVDKAFIRDKRSVQNKVVEYLALRLFQKSTIEQLLDILFNDMAQDALIYDQTQDMHFQVNHDEHFRVVTGAAAKSSGDLPLLLDS